MIIKGTLVFTYIQRNGININIQVIDLSGLSNLISVPIERDKSTPVSTTISFDRLNPLGKKVKKNKDALALIIGIEEYEKTNAKNFIK